MRKVAGREAFAQLIPPRINLVRAVRSDPNPNARRTSPGNFHQIRDKTAAIGTVAHEQLYRVERQAQGEAPQDGDTQADSIGRFRQKHSVPILNALKQWLDEVAPKVLPDSKLDDAVGYTLNQWARLTRYTEDGRMPIDNNLLERDIRIFATGRKSWLFSDTVGGARASAVIYSLMLTCRACGVEPFDWLRHALTELPQRAEHADIQDLLPFNFPKAAAA